MKRFEDGLGNNVFHNLLETFNFVGPYHNRHSNMRFEAVMNQ